MIGDPRTRLDEQAQAMSHFALGVAFKPTEGVTRSAVEPG
jgi:hypothetical protein